MVLPGVSHIVNLSCLELQLLMFGLEADGLAAVLVLAVDFHEGVTKTCSDKWTGAETLQGIEIINNSNQSI